MADYIGCYKAHTRGSLLGAFEPFSEVKPPVMISRNSGTFLTYKTHFRDGRELYFVNAVFDWHANKPSNTYFRIKGRTKEGVQEVAQKISDSLDMKLAHIKKSEYDAFLCDRFQDYLELQQALKDATKDADLN